MDGAKVARSLLWAVYPFVVFFSLDVIEPRILGLLLLLLLILRHHYRARLFLRGLGWLSYAVLAALVALSVGVMVTNSEPLLRLYPAAINLGMLLLFGLSLLRPPSMIEQFARLHKPQFSAADIGYTRRVTVVWCVFFVANGALAAYTALIGSRELWALYNGLIAYVLIGALMGGEWLYRRYVRGERA
ncbi:MAG: hypothetical protein K8S22_10145 [Betaproteobacteria bacterium]|nr:hypothetical protein [Betaproteobacteria bacterium]